jgi:hypothetical protein
MTGRKTFRLALIGPSFIYGRDQRGPRRGSERPHQSAQCSYRSCFQPQIWQGTRWLDPICDGISCLRHP